MSAIEHEPEMACESTGKKKRSRDFFFLEIQCGLLWCGSFLIETKIECEKISMEGGEVITLWSS